MGRWIFRTWVMKTASAAITGWLFNVMRSPIFSLRDADVAKDIPINTKSSGLIFTKLPKKIARTLLLAHN
jgi:hypothetical protein